MQNVRNRTTATLIALFLMSAMVISLVALPAANAQKPVHRKKTYAYIGATPNPVGVGQETLIHVGITDELENVAQGWLGLTVTVTKPDGTTETLGPFMTDSTGGTGYVYVPSMVGNYTLQTHFPAQWFNWTLYGGASIWYEASDSNKLTLVVTKEPVQIWPGIPLPTEYWTRPIDAQSREWYSIAGNWLEPMRNVGPFTPYNKGPETAHILWAKPLTLGGLVGGELGLVGSGGTSVAIENGDAYEGLWGYGSPVIINGVMCYNKYKDIGTTALERSVVAVDLRTGEELWDRALIGPDNVSRQLEFGQLFYWQSYNYQGTFAYLWTTVGSTWNAFDPFTGRWVYTMTDVPSGTNIRGSRGEIYRYTVDLARGWMTLWNSSRVVSTSGSWIRGSMGTTFNATRGIEWNKTITKGLPVGNTGINAFFLEDRMIGTTADDRTAYSNVLGKTDKPLVVWGVSLKPGQEGQLLFNKTWQPPTGNLSLTFERASLKDGVFTVWSKELKARVGFSTDTGEYLWVTEPEHYLQVFGRQSNIAYGKLFSTGFGGFVYAYDLKTGKRLWTYEVSDPYTEILWSDNWPMGLLFTVDGKIYVGESEHSVNQPMPRGGPFVCLNTTTGEEIWRIDGAFRQARWAGQAAIADSIIATFNTYDNRIYAIGKGPSATTVTAAPEVSVHGSSVLIKGTVTDISAGTKETALTARFPSGVPAIADESMSEWMKYLYLQFPRPTNATGVEVTLDTVDPNGNFVHIDTVKSDSTGMFKKAFTPEVPGEYTIIATFPGSKSYWASYAETAINVEEAPPATPPVEIPVYPDYTPLFTGIIVAVVLAIVIGIVNLMMLRRRK